MLHKLSQRLLKLFGYSSAHKNRDEENKTKNKTEIKVTLHFSRQGSEAGEKERWFCGKMWHRIKKECLVSEVDIQKEINRLQDEYKEYKFTLRKEVIATTVTTVCFETENKWDHKKLHNGIKLDSPWEAIFVKRLDDSDVKWVKNHNVKFEYTREDGTQTYATPDFWLPDYGIFVDPHSKKLMSKDKGKIKILEEKYGGMIVWLDTIDKCKNFSIDNYEPITGREPIVGYESTKEKIKERIKNNVVLYGRAFYRVVLDWTDILIQELMVCFCRKI